MKINQKIKETACKCAPEYPGIEKKGPMEQLDAIEAAFEGIDIANKKLHLLINFLEQKGFVSEGFLFRLRERISENLITEEEFNNYIQDYIDKGLVDGCCPFSMSEVNNKCMIYENCIICPMLYHDYSPEELKEQMSKKGE